MFFLRTGPRCGIQLDSSITTAAFPGTVLAAPGEPRQGNAETTVLLHSFPPMLHPCILSPVPLLFPWCFCCAERCQSGVSSSSLCLRLVRLPRALHFRISGVFFLRGDEGATPSPSQFGVRLWTLPGLITHVEGTCTTSLELRGQANRLQEPSSRSCAGYFWLQKGQDRVPVKDPHSPLGFLEHRTASARFQILSIEQQASNIKQHAASSYESRQGEN